MSFLNFIITDDFISVICDGQLSIQDVAVENNYKKFTVYQNKYIFASTGHNTPWEHAQKEIEKNNNLNFDEIKKIIQRTANLFKGGQTNMTKEKAEFSLFLSAFHESRAQVFQIYVNGNNLLEETFYAPRSVVSNPHDINFDAGNIIGENIKVINGRYMLSNVISSQKKALNYVANASNTVNHVVFHKVIRK